MTLKAELIDTRPHWECYVPCDDKRVIPSEIYLTGGQVWLVQRGTLQFYLLVECKNISYLCLAFGGGYMGKCLSTVFDMSKITQIYPEIYCGKSKSGLRIVSECQVQL